MVSCWPDLGPRRRLRTTASPQRVPFKKSLKTNKPFRHSEKSPQAKQQQYRENAQFQTRSKVLFFCVLHALKSMPKCTVAVVSKKVPRMIQKSEEVKQQQHHRQTSVSVVVMKARKRVKERDRQACRAAAVPDYRSTVGRPMEEL